MSVDKIIAADGQPQFGVFAQPVAQMNAADYQYRNAMGKVRTGLGKRMAYKQFQYFGIISEDLIGGCALAHTGWVGTCFVYLFKPSTGEMLEHLFRVPLGWGLQMSQSSVAGESRFDFMGNRVRLGYEAEPAAKTLTVELRNGLSIDARFDEAQPAFQPLNICTKAGRYGWVYAQKAAGVSASGKVRCAWGEFDLQALGACAHHDYSAGHMRRETYWQWACFSGIDGQGRRLGLNVSCGVNETSFSENCAWLDGECLPLPATHFEFDPDNAVGPWRVSDQHGRVALQFEAVGAHTQRMNTGVLAVDFKQIFGRFNGVITLQNGQQLVVENLWGFVEDQYAKW